MQALARSISFPWTGRDGQFSALRFIVFFVAAAPACWMALKWNMGWLSPKPVTDLLRESGDWAMRFVVVALAISPLRHAGRWNRVIAVRRMIGLFALFYALVHLTLYFVDQNFVWTRIALEIVLRLYLTIGFAALLIFLALGATSSDAMVKRLGAARWNRLHMLVYAAAFLAIVHYFMQVRLKAYESSLIAGLLLLLAGYRLSRRWRGDVGPAWSLLLACLAGLATAAIEAGYYRFSMNAPFMRVFESNLDFSPLEYSWEIRPAWYVLLAGLGLTAIIGLRQLKARSPFLRQAFLKTETARHR